MKKDLLLPIICGFIIIAASAYLIADYTMVSQSGGEVIGTIYFKNNIAERKSGGQVIWDTLKKSAPLYSNDTIRTGENSSSIIRFNNKQEIELGDNTLIVLDMGSKGLKVDFAGGSIHAKTGTDQPGATAEGAPSVSSGAEESISASEESSVTISSGSMEVELGKASADISKNADNTYSVNVTEGKAKIHRGKKEITVDSTQSVRVSKKEISVKKSPVKYISPAPNSHFIITKPSIPVRFEWSAGSGRGQKIQISSKKDFSKLLINTKTAGSTHTAEMKAGYYYWRVITGDGDAGPVQRFSVFTERPASPVTPRRDTQISYATQPPAVRFSWSGGDEADSYSLEISADPDMKKIIRKQQVFSKSITIDSIREGKYYWHVVSNYGTLRADSQTNGKPFSFTIKKAKNLPAIRLISPSDSASTSTDYLRNNRFLFTWHRSDEVKEYRFTIYSDSALKSVVKQAMKRDNYYELVSPLQPGEYFWTVSGIAASGITSDLGKPNRLTVGSLMPVQLTSPARGEILSDNEGGRIQFLWKDPNRWGNYKIELGADAKFSKILKGIFSRDTSVAVSGVKPGKIFWRVKLLNKGNGTLYVSPVFDVYMPTSLPQPVVTSPENNSIVEMAKRDTVPFVWHGVPGATHYKIKFYTYGDAEKKPITETLTKEKKYNFGLLEKLDRGKYCFEIQSLAYSFGAITGSSPVKKIYFSISLTQKIDPPKIITPRAVYVK